VVILPEQPSNHEPRAPEVLREEVEVVDAFPVHAHHLQTHGPESHPCRPLFAINPGPKAEATAQTKAAVRYGPAMGRKRHQQRRRKT